jgi:hypothetical protein
VGHLAACPVQALQKAQRLLGREIADARARIKKHARLRCLMTSDGPR